MADPPVPTEALPDELEAAARAFEAARRAGDLRWDLSRDEEAGVRTRAGIEAVFAAGMAAGRTRAADYLDQRARVIHDSATTYADKGMAAGLFNVARELRELPEGQENTLMAAPKPNCGRCNRPFNPFDSSGIGRAQYRDTPWCWSCVDRCHESTDFAHECVICAGPPTIRRVPADDCMCPGNEDGGHSWNCKIVSGVSGGSD